MREQQIIVGGFAYGGIFEPKQEDAFGVRPIQKRVQAWRLGRWTENPRTIVQRENWENLQAPIGTICVPGNAFDMS